MTATASDLGVAGFDVIVGGVPIDDAVRAALLEIVVDARLRVPDRLTLHLRDDDGELVAGPLFFPGTAVKVSLGAAEDAASSVVFDGVVTSLTSGFEVTSTTLTVVALDRGCMLQRKPGTMSYERCSYGEIARKVLATDARALKAGTIGAGLTVPFVQRSNETAWDFLWRLARDVDYEVKVTGTQLNFRPAGGPRTGSTAAVTLTLGEDLRSFSPRISAIQQVGTVDVRGWDPVVVAPLKASAETKGRDPHADAALHARVARALGPGGATVVDHPFVNARQAGEAARSIAAHIANALIEAEGVADGNPRLGPGTRVTITGIPRTFAGTYVLSGVRHVLRAGASYETRFFVSGREDRSLLGLAASPARPREGWGRRIVAGIVTNNDDPERQGRVRVRYPALADMPHDGWWARILTTGAGGSRGFLSLPKVGDEVLIAFEHESEQHPYVLGTVFNGKGLPGELSKTDSSFGLFSDKQLIIRAKDKVAVTADKAIEMTTATDAKLDARGSATVNATGVTVDSKAALTAKALTSVTVEAAISAAIKAGLTMTLGATRIDIDGNGLVSISGPVVTIKADTLVRISAPLVKLGQ